MSAEPTKSEATSEAVAAQPPVNIGGSIEFAVPGESQNQLRLIQASINELACRLGHIQVDYFQNSNRLSMEITKLRAEYEQLLHRVAQGAGLDIDKTRWNFDAATMKLVRVPQPE